MAANLPLATGRILAWTVVSVLISLGSTVAAQPDLPTARSQRPVDPDKGLTLYDLYDRGTTSFADFYHSAGINEESLRILPGYTLDQEEEDWELNVGTNVAILEFEYFEDFDSLPREATTVLQVALPQIRFLDYPWTTRNAPCRLVRFEAGLLTEREQALNGRVQILGRRDRQLYMTVALEFAGESYEIRGPVQLADADDVPFQAVALEAVPSR